VAAVCEENLTAVAGQVGDFLCRKDVANLRPSDARLIVALLITSSKRRAARRAGVGIMTLYRRLRDERFRGALDKAKLLMLLEAPHIAAHERRMQLAAVSEQARAGGPAGGIGPQPRPAS
jgi:hypothetical protein